MSAIALTGSLQSASHLRGPVRRAAPCARERNGFSGVFIVTWCVLTPISEMLSRKVSASGSGPGLMDRGRVGERLQAALAGLHELHLLREQQGAMVHRALRMHLEEPETPAATTGSTATGSMLANEEQRLEATLTALKQQLSRLRRQDVGLKTHLQQLDLQISELKLDANKAPGEPLESDSRPSSGFYELSDGGSCSLSNSCTSVYSECLSSSQSSLLQSPVGAPQARHASPALGETATAPPAAGPRTSGPHPGGSRIRTGAAGLERPRPRPVSMGDLDRMMAAGPGCFKSVPGQKPVPVPAPRTATLDARFQSSLMSRGGAEVYHYPSPLHAVALHSPIFTPAGEPPAPAEAQGPPARALTCPTPDPPQKGPARPETGYLGYIDKVLQRNTIRTSTHGRERRDPQWTRSEPRREPGVSSPSAGTRAGPPPQPGPTLGALDLQSLEAKWERECSPDPPSAPLSSAPAPESVQRYSHPAALRGRGPEEAPAQRPPGPEGEHAALLRSHSEKRASLREPRVVQRKCAAQKAVLGPVSNSEDRLGWDSRLDSRPDPCPAAPHDFVTAKFVPAGSQQVKVRQADRKTKAVKLRRRAGEKPCVLRPPQGYSSGERARESQGSGYRGEPEPRRSGKGKASPRLGEQHRHSGSDSSLCGPGFVHPHRGHPKPVSYPAKPGKGRRPQRPEPEPPADPRRRRVAEVCQAPGAPRTRDPYTSRPTAHAAASARLHPVQWAGPPPRAYRPSVSPAGFFSALNSRYPPAPYPAGGCHRPPPRCESEYSAECASLFHSTIAASSGGELSDDTANRFGDSESSSDSSRSCSDSDSSLSLEEEEERRGGALVWAQPAQGPTAGLSSVALQRGHPTRPGPPACRIKASRALKKKIRRFQPASLKVMTLV